MIKPVQIVWQGRKRWTASKAKQVEYLAWQAAAPVLHDMLKMGMAKEFESDLSTNSLSNLLTALVRQGRLVRLQRGMFVHVDHVGIFE